ncbi:MAG: HD domain-containing protein [Peptococcaceae bacterium]|nr:HD domain-containing protein [Peptococcaceae bacterium]
MDDRYNDLLNLVQDKMSYAAHDFDHVLRVYQLAMFLAEDEESVDRDVLIPAVLLHDIARRLEDEDPTGKTDHALVGAVMVGKILQELGYDEQLISKIKDCIASHRFRSGSPPSSPEAKILYDADKLDVIGAVGIARSYMLGGRHGERMYLDIPLAEYMAKNVGENGRIKDVAQHAANLEFELKLKHIPDKLFTAKAKALAKQRLDFMYSFFEVLKQEIDGQR